jgi:hypothetical protein
MAGKHDVYVYPDPSAPTLTFKVRPAVAFASAGDRFSVRNLTGNPVSLAFGVKVFYEGPTPPPFTSETKVFHIVTSADGFYAYTVTVNVGGVNYLAQGESDPGVIIDP